MGRAGAFVAGADDGQSVWMNPAGLSDAGNSLSTDAAVIVSPMDYTRQSETRDADGVRRVGEFPKVTGAVALVPIPSVIYTRLLSPKWTGALSMLVPYGPQRSFPATVNGEGAPQRYSDISQDGSALVIVGAHAAYKFSDSFRVGAGLQVLVGALKDHKVVQSALPDRLITAPESPEFDSDLTIRVGPIVSPSANAGLVWVPSPHLRVGASVQAPFYVSAPATLAVVLPSSAVLRGARQNGDSATVSTWLPPFTRVGVEYRTAERGAGLRVEAAWVREFASVFDKISVKPDNVSIDNISVLPSPLPIRELAARNRTIDYDSLRLGAEYTYVPRGGTEAVEERVAGTWQFRGGAQYNGESVEPGYTQARTYGPAHVLATLGLGYQLSRKVALDAMYAKALRYSATVNPRDAGVKAELIFEGNPTTRESHNGGVYEASLDVFGLGLRYAL